MALTSTLFTGLSGLDVNQTRLNVVGNNIANVNTVAFKASRALFKPQFYVTDAAASPPTPTSAAPTPASAASARSSPPSRRISRPARSSPPARTPTWPSTATASSSSRVRGSSSPATARSRSTAANQLVTTGGEFVQGFRRRWQTEHHSRPVGKRHYSARQHSTLAKPRPRTLRWRETSMHPARSRQERAFCSARM